MKFRVTRNADGSFARDREILQVLDEIPARNDQIDFLDPQGIGDVDLTELTPPIGPYLPTDK